MEVLPEGKGQGAPFRLRTSPVPGAGEAGAEVVLAAGALRDGDGRAAGAAGAVVEAWARVVGPRTVLLASPRSFCAGVECAIHTAEGLLTTVEDGAVFVRKQIVHDTHVVKDLERRGAVFVAELDEVLGGAAVVFSAHGVAPAVRAEAAARHLAVVDATWPLVTKVHSEARRFAARGDTVILVGHRGHEEIEGTLGEAPGQTVLVENVADVAALEVADVSRVSYLTQTTLAVDETAEIIAALRARFPALRGPGSEDICYATTNRQQAVVEVVKRSDVLLVVGSADSSNSVRMVEVARRSGCAAHLVEDASGIRPYWVENAATVGLSAGASAPPALVEDVLTALGGLGPVAVAEHATATETVSFVPPTAARTS
ncbi:4-hydroxy-3-methylbut-2-enyl diphosphate reductase [Streptomyces sp. NRRL B-1347]|uniref:4-hydroxy-3-methylbut-2-enyl diphosphate reductase n=1 Tax=Streptomyces sp. NRRL B-1347 TaxID=1476877 RepID=UPI0022773C83|nr:4-hydroxy-3-methylbut-2-enyl diphosphate reductase [Streptomyces sp. NRRL B-1347]